MEKSEIEALVQRYAHNECTREEWLQLLSVVTATEQEAALQEALEKVWTTTTAAELPVSLRGRDELYPLRLPLPAPVPIWRRKATWITAAAVVTGLLVATYAVRWWTVPKPAAVVAQASTDVAPGHQGAVLTLGDGRQLALDSAQNGVVAQQGNAPVVNHNGQLRYQAGTTSAALVYNTVTTPRARQYQLVLPDGSKVWLNAASSIRYPVAFNATERKVAITGEAYFEIAPNAGAPFRVVTQGMEVQVLGTHFNINSYNDEGAVKTTLTAGAVNIKSGNQVLPLRPGQQSSLTSGKLMLVPTPDVESALAWKDGLFLYNGASLDEIMRQVARWYDVDVVYKDKIAEAFVATIPRDVPVSQVLELLEATGHVHFHIEQRVITVMR